jgi:hypothetical protein
MPLLIYLVLTILVQGLSAHTGDKNQILSLASPSYLKPSTFVRFVIKFDGAKIILRNLEYFVRFADPTTLLITNLTNMNSFQVATKMGSCQFILYCILGPWSAMSACQFRRCFKLASCNPSVAHVSPSLQNRSNVDSHSLLSTNTT